MNRNRRNLRILATLASVVDLGAALSYAAQSEATKP